MSQSPRVVVPLLDLKPQYQALKAELDAALLKVAASQHFILGPAVKELEAQVAAYSGAKHGIGLSSGTDALLIALMAYDLGPGDEVVTTPYTFFATGGTVARVGARPVYLDIDPVTYNLRVDLVRKFLEKRLRAPGRRRLQPQDRRPRARDHARPPLRAARRHGRIHEARARVRARRDRGRGAGDRRRGGRRQARRRHRRHRLPVVLPDQEPRRLRRRRHVRHE